MLKMRLYASYVDNLDYYKEEMNDWERKKEKALKIENIDFAELCQNWIDSYEIAIQKVLHALTNEEVELTEEVAYNE